ncbi:MAG: FAD:protein FMN transferase [Clostridia bacterium]|nr:FAD:protein FMN transferase [Clostridia bacterium]
MSKKVFSLILAVLMAGVALFTGCSEGNRHEATITGYFDTVITIVAYMDKKSDFDKEVQRIAQELAIYDGLSDAYASYKGGNNIKTINDKAGKGKPVNVNLFIIDMLLTAKKAYATSGGAINVAMGAVTDIWRTHINNGMADAGYAVIPSLDELREAGRHTNIDDVIIDSENRTVYLQDEKMRLDVGAFAKGYAATLVLHNAKQRGVTSMLLNMGGAVSTIGTKPNGQPFTVGVQNPRNEEEYSLKLGLNDMSVSTSGDYQRYYVVNGIRFHHIIDTGNLMPTLYAASVSVVCEDAITADYLSTTLMAMPLEEGLKLVNSYKDVEALWIFGDGTQKCTSGFEAYITK